MTLSNLRTADHQPTTSVILADPAVIELAQMLDFIVYATTDAIRALMPGVPAAFFTDRFTTDYALNVAVEAYETNRAGGHAPGRAAGKAGAQMLSRAIVGMNDRLLNEISHAVEAAHDAQRQH
ncbi:hypothetical protein [Streptomyces olivaceus]|uniref:hypothetical protein n=1 Tax=Streptomyces olivaceus TaxID=47716 RepID=UPI0022EF0A64|nr:hypothetical protein [Streptomyces olivaceus]GHI98094.1 hypothetical protein TPA0905_75650 [Streptomyces olivaceus]